MSSSHWSDSELSFGSKMRDLGFQVLLEQIAFSSVSGLCLVHRGKQLKKSTLELRVKKGSIIFLFLLPLLKIRPLSFLLVYFACSSVVSHLQAPQLSLASHSIKQRPGQVVLLLSKLSACSQVMPKHFNLTQRQVLTLFLGLFPTRQPRVHPYLGNPFSPSMLTSFLPLPMLSPLECNALPSLLIMG